MPEGPEIRRAGEPSARRDSLAGTACAATHGSAVEENRHHGVMPLFIIVVSTYVKLRFGQRFL